MNKLEMNRVADFDAIPNPSAGTKTYFRVARIPRWMQKNSEGVVTCCKHDELSEIRALKKSL